MKMKTARELLDEFENKSDLTLADGEDFKAQSLLLRVLRGTLLALENVVKPAHDEPDDYTRLGCAKHHANEALEEAALLLQCEAVIQNEKPSICSAHRSYVKSCPRCEALPHADTWAAKAAYNIVGFHEGNCSFYVAQPCGCMVFMIADALVRIQKETRSDDAKLLRDLVSDVPRTAEQRATYYRSIRDAADLIENCLL